MSISRDRPSQTVYQSIQSLEFPSLVFSVDGSDIKQTFHWALHQSHKRALLETFPGKENMFTDSLSKYFIYSNHIRTCDSNLSSEKVVTWERRSLIKELRA